MTKRKLNKTKIFFTLFIVIAITAFLTYLPHAMDENWKQQYEQPLKYLEDIEQP